MVMLSTLTGSPQLDTLASGLAAFIALAAVTMAWQWLSDWWSR